MADRNERQRRQRKEGNPAPALRPEERHRMVAEAAYYRAERRRFCDGSPEKDWMEAEAEVERSLAKRETRSRSPEARPGPSRSASP